MVLKKVFDKKAEAGPTPALKPEQWPAEVEDGNGNVVKVDGGSDKVKDAVSHVPSFAEAAEEYEAYIRSCRDLIEYYRSCGKGDRAAALKEDIREAEAELEHIGSERRRYESNVGYDDVEDKVSDASSGDSVYAAAQRWAADYLASLDYPAYRDDLKSAVIRAYLLVQHMDLVDAYKEAVAMLIRNVK